MGLHDLIGAVVRWISRPGMMWGDVFTCISTQLFHTTPPDMLVIHCGGNSIGALPLLDLRLKMFETISELATILPNTLLVWSEILPRSCWRYMSSTIAAEKSRIRLNNAIATHVLNLGGAYIKHLELNKYNNQMFSLDGVHLSELGNNVFLDTLQGALYLFSQTHSSVYPDHMY